MSETLLPVPPAIQPPKKITSDDIKLSKFARFYLDQTNETTYGHATNSAIHAFNLEIPRQYGYARRIGSQMVAKCNNVAQAIMENHGATLPYMIQFALDKMQTLKDERLINKYWNDLLNLSGGRKMIEQQIVNVFNQNNTNNVQTNIVQLSAEDQKKFNANFLDFVNKGGELPA